MQSLAARPTSRGSHLRECLLFQSEWRLALGLPEPSCCRSGLRRPVLLWTLVRLKSPQRLSVAQVPVVMGISGEDADPSAEASGSATSFWQRHDICSQHSGLRQPCVNYNSRHLSYPKSAHRDNLTARSEIQSIPNACPHLRNPDCGSTPSISTVPHLAFPLHNPTPTHRS